MKNVSEKQITITKNVTFFFLLSLTCKSNGVISRLRHAVVERNVKNKFAFIKSPRIDFKFTVKLVEMLLFVKRHRMVRNSAIVFESFEKLVVRIILLDTQFHIILIKRDFCFPRCIALLKDGVLQRST